MSFIFNGLKAAVTISGSVGIGYPSPTTAQTSKVMIFGAKGGTNVVAGTGATVGAITGGKSFYCSALSVSVHQSSGWELRDGGSAGTILCCGKTLDTIQAQVLTFPTPIQFTTSLWFDVEVTSVSRIAAIGYEQ